MSVSERREHPAQHGGDRQDAERLAPPERPAGDVGRERRHGAGRGQGEAERDRHEQDADLGHPQRKGVAVLQHGEDAEHDDQPGGAARPRQPPRPRAAASPATTGT